ncbi:MAG: SH3 domain-containing protein, partial [Clostridia bacterium]
YKLDQDGTAGPITQTALFALATGGSISGGGSTGGGSTGGGTVDTTGTLRTTSSVNLRKTASTKAARLGVVPKGVSLTYTDSTVKGGVTWYKITYNNLHGWIMGTYTSASSGG